LAASRAAGRYAAVCLHFGQAFENEDAHEDLPAITIELAADGARPPLTVELAGRTSVLVETPDGPRASVILSCRAKGL